MDSIFPIFIEPWVQLSDQVVDLCHLPTGPHHHLPSCSVVSVLTSIVLGSVSASVVARGPGMLVLAPWQ